MYCMEIKEKLAIGALNALEERLFEPVSSQTSYLIDNYNNEMIHNFPENRPLYFGHIFSYARKSENSPNGLPLGY